MARAPDVAVAQEPGDIFQGKTTIVQADVLI
jgi:hypothetical protein